MCKLVIITLALLLIPVISGCQNVPDTTEYDAKPGEITGTVSNPTNSVIVNSVAPYIVQIIFGASDNDWQSLTRSPLIIIASFLTSTLNWSFFSLIKG